MAGFHPAALPAIVLLVDLCLVVWWFVLDPTFLGDKQSELSSVSGLQRDMKCTIEHCGGLHAKHWTYATGEITSSSIALRSFSLFWVVIVQFRSVFWTEQTSGFCKQRQDL